MEQKGIGDGIWSNCNCVFVTYAMATVHDACNCVLCCFHIDSKNSKAGGEV